MDEQEREHELVIRRILIGLDASRHSMAALRAAAQLAVTLEAQLHGLFVEDATLLKVSKLPVAREIQFPFATRAPLSPRRMRRQLRAQAQQARKALASISKEHGVEWSFEVARGEVSVCMLEESTRADLLCLGRASRPLTLRSCLGSTAVAAASAASRSVLLVSRETEIGPPVVLLCDGSDEGRQALRLSWQLADAMKGLLSIVVPASVAESSEQVQEQITDELDGEELLVRYRELSGSGIRSFINAAHTEGAGMLVLHRSSVPSEDLEELLVEVACPVLLVG